MAAVSHPDERSLDHFRTNGWMRVRGAFSPDAAARMRNRVWAALANVGIHADRPESWTVERPPHLQHLKNDPVFREIGSNALFEAIDAVFDGLAYDPPKYWGAFFIAFPSAEEWNVPSCGWHIDAHYQSPLFPTYGLKTFAFLGDVISRGGGTQILNGSHRLIYDWFRSNPPPPGAWSADMRKLLQAHPYIGALHMAGEPENRIARFIDRTETIDGIQLGVTDITATAGDVIILHPLTLHVAARNKARQPRFLVSGGITTDNWGWGSQPGPG